MKAIRITMDEALLERLDETDEVKREGRSAVLGRATAEYLARRSARLIGERYRMAYGAEGAAERESGVGLGAGFEGWEEQGTRPGE